MKDAEDEAFDELAKRQGAWGGGFKAKQAMAADKLQEPWNEDEWRRNNWRCGHGWLRGEQCESCNAAQEPYDQTALELCNVCGWKTLIPDDCCLNCERAQPAQEVDYWIREATAARQAEMALRRELEAQPAQEPVVQPAPGYCKNCKDYTIEEPLPAQPAQEPVAWMVYTQDGKSVYVTDNPTDIQEGQRALPLYTTPPQRTWVELTDDEVMEMMGYDKQYGHIPQYARNFVEAISAKLKEKNG